VRKQKLAVTEINFLCIHKKLRSKRLAPVLIKEITRRCYLLGIYQAIYTAGVVLPKPVASCRYYHRALNWLKLYDVGFSPLPNGMTKSRMVTKNHLPAHTATPNLRPMELKDVPGVHSLLTRYLKRFDLAQEFTKEEIEHWFVHNDKPDVHQVVWAYVAEDPSTHKITDIVSYYLLESTVIDNAKYNNVRAAYLYYYASETVFESSQKEYVTQLRSLINDALILAKSVSYPPHNFLSPASINERSPTSTSSTPSLSMIIRFS
jgi:glycylpeptide N-tetradecanoyltransferase